MNLVVVCSKLEIVWLAVEKRQNLDFSVSLEGQKDILKSNTNEDSKISINQTFRQHSQPQQSCGV